MLQKSQKWRLSVEIILLNNACEYHKPVFSTEFIFSNNQNLHSHAYLWVSLQKHVISAALYGGCWTL